MITLTPAASGYAQKGKIISDNRRKNSRKPVHSYRPGCMQKELDPTVTTVSGVITLTTKNHCYRGFII